MHFCKKSFYFYGNIIHKRKLIIKKLLKIYTYINYLYIDIYTTLILFIYMYYRYSLHIYIPLLQYYIEINDYYINIHI